MKQRFHADEPTRRFRLEIDGVGTFDQWTSAEVTRDLQEFSGSFDLSLRDATRSIASFDYASPPPLYRLDPGPGCRIFIDDVLELVGWIEKVDTNINADFAEVSISGRDKSGDLVDCACAPDGPGELVNRKLDAIAMKIAEPFGLSVRVDVDVGAPFPRFPLGLAETGLAAIERGARQRHALVTSDGQGGIAITRTGSDAAPADLRLPGNMLSSAHSKSTENRHSETIVRGQAEKAQGARKGRTAPQTPGDAPKAPEARQDGDGSATERERLGTAITGRSVDPEITRHRPIVHLTRSQPDQKGTQDEADWRNRTARANGEGLETEVHGYGVGGRPWAVNQLTEVADSYSGVFRPMLIDRTSKRYDESGAITTISLKSPEAFDAEPVGTRRTNLKRGGGKASGGSRSGLDGTARTL